MEVIKPNLFLNYERPIGRKWTGSLTADTNQFRVAFSGLRVYSEALIPAAGTGEDSGNTLTAISNAIFEDARRHNMSLSSFGHNDPIKYSVASTFIGLLMMETRTRLAVACKYSFGNKYFGAALCGAYNIKNVDINADYPNLASRYNKLVARVNNLMIPEIKLFKKWMKHRVTIYKDDEGDRYSLYLYRMANYYYLDVDAQSPTVGQLKNVFIQDSSNQWNTISYWLTLIERLVASYEGDDDMVSFATEAIKAGMNHLVLDTIPSNGEAFAMLEFPIVYELDDLLSCENAKVICPMEFYVNTDKVWSWDIIEHKEQFYVGVITDIQNHKIYGRLPCFVPKMINGALPANLLISGRPIFTHAKIKSVEGCESLTRYLGSLKKLTVSTAGFQGTLWKYRGFFHNVQSISGTASNIDVYALDTHGTEIITNVSVLTDLDLSSLGQEIKFADFKNVPIVYDYLYDMVTETTSKSELLTYFLDRTVGFKCNFAVYLAADAERVISLVRDYDYITSVSEDALQNFFAALAWNYTQLSSHSEANNNQG